MRIIKIEIRSANEMIISGYVNAVSRDSKVIGSPHGKFVEQVMPKTFARALEKNPNVELRFNHSKVLGNQSDGTLELREDNIGLFATAKVTDPEVIENARKKELRGWSFGFIKNKDSFEDTKMEGIQRRFLEDIDLKEVSILTKNPAYSATSIELRGEETITLEERNLEDDVEILETQEKREESAVISYDLYNKQIQILKLNGGNKQ